MQKIDIKFQRFITILKGEWKIVIKEYRGLVRTREDGSEIINYDDASFPIFMTDMFTVDAPGSGFRTFIRTWR